jgi:hypothetical protein
MFGDLGLSLIACLTHVMRYLSSGNGGNARACWYRSSPTRLPYAIHNCYSSRRHSCICTCSSSTFILEVYGSTVLLVLSHGRDGYITATNVTRTHPNQGAGRVISLNHAPIKRPSFDTQRSPPPPYAYLGSLEDNSVTRPHGHDREAPYLHRLVRSRGVHHWLTHRLEKI